MALVNVNGHGAVEARVWFPRSGLWNADLVVDSADDLTGPVTISIDEGRLVLQGTVWRGGQYLDKSMIQVVAGADGLRQIAKAKHYNGANARVVLSDLLSSVGEKLSATADDSTLRAHVPAWTTASLPVGHVLALLLASAAPAANWRSLPDGTIWVGPETWPASALTADDYQIMNEDPRQLTALLGAQAPLVLAGTTLGGRRVSYVQHVINAEGVRGYVWFEDPVTATPVRDRLKEAFAAAVKSVAGVDYFACYWARVVSQSGSTIDVEIDNPTVAKFMPTMARVPLTMPAPGASVSMAAIGRVLIGWSGGDPARPYAFAPDADTHLNKLVLNADQLFLGGETGAQPAIMGTTYRKAEDAYLKAISAGLSAALGAVGLPSAVTALATADTAWSVASPTFLATKTKVS